MAPIAPFYADRLVRDLTGKSVHLSSWPQYDESQVDSFLEESMALATQATSIILALRKRANRRVRQPLQKAVVPAADEKMRQQLMYVQELIRSEVNVKELLIVDSSDAAVQLVKKIKPNFRILGKKVGAQMKTVAAAIAGLSQAEIAQFEQQGSFTLQEPVVTLVAEDVEIITEDMPGWLVESNGSITVALDIELTEELEQEGKAREIINRLQNLRKSSGLEITDRVVVCLQRNDYINSAVENFNDYIASQVLATEVQLTDNLISDSEIEVDGQVIKVSLVKK